MYPTLRPLAVLTALLAISLALMFAHGHGRPASADAEGGFFSELVFDGVSVPTDFAFAPDGRIFIALKSGAVRIVEDGVLLPTPFIQLVVNANHERGLLGIALDPNFDTNGYVYLYYVTENDPTNYGGPKTAQLLRVTAGGDVAVPGSGVVLLGSIVGDPASPSCSDFPIGSDCIPATRGSHNGGGLRFAPDGKLFLSIGDAETGLPSQDLNSFSGKLVRINADGTTPTDNPFYTGDPSTPRSKFWSYGLRNPFRIAIQPGTGTPFIGDVGDGLWEEIDLGTPGANYGWPCYEATVQRFGGPVCEALWAAGTQTPPIFTYAHPPGAAIIVGSFYNGVNYPPEFQGALFFGDYVRNKVWSVRFDATNQVVPGSFTEVLPNASLPVSFAIGPEGNVYYLSLAGKVYRIRYVTGNRPPVAVASATPVVGIPPLPVQFTSNESYDPDLEPLSYLWDFGDGDSSAEANPVHSYTADGQYVATLTVTDSEGVTAADTIALDIGNHAPVVTISAPAGGLIYEPGAGVAFSGTATDFEDGVIVAAGLQWDIILRHCEAALGSCHFHPYWQASGNDGVFSTDDVHASNPDFRYHELTLTATDSLGATGSATVIISPDTDGDGLSDYAEYFQFDMDPFDTDSDDDGATDGAEDYDGDGCGNVAELQTAAGSQTSGGLRDPFDPWDYFNPSGDGINRADDILAVVAKYGHDQGVSPDYSVNFDRSLTPGLEPWRFGPPDGMIRSYDVSAAVRSYGHDCPH